MATMTAGTLPARAATPGVNGRIAYTGRTAEDGDDSGTLSVMNADGTGQQVIASTGYGDSLSTPSWSPDGRKVAVSNWYQVMANRFASPIEVVNLDGTGSYPLAGPFCGLFITPYDLFPQWSPDGRQLAVTNGCSNTVDIYDAQTGQRTESRMYAGFANQIGYPPAAVAWAPDSWRLAVATSTGIIVDDRTTQLKIATGAAQNPDWSPDGTTLAYTVVRSGHNDVYTVPAIGGRPTAVTTTPTVDENDPAFSPSGALIAWGQDGNIVTRPVVGGAPTTLAAGNEPAWQPLAPRPVVGNPIVERSSLLPLRSDRTRVTKFAFAAGVPQTISRLRAYVDGLGRTTGSQKLRGVIYADGGGRPGALVATTGELTVTAGSAGAWRDLTFASAPHLASGTYWLGLQSGPSETVARVASTSHVQRPHLQSVDAYADGPATTFGAGTAEALTMSIYAFGGS